MIFTRSHTVRWLAITLACLAGSAPARAQDAPPPVQPSVPTLAPHPFGQVRLGTMFVAPTFSLRDVGYDTNVFDLSGVERQPADFTATVEPGVEVGLTTPRLAIRTLTRVSYVYYQTYKTEQAFNQALDLTVDDRLSSHLALYAKGTYGYGKERTGFEVDSRQRSLSQMTTTGLKLGSRKLQLDLHGTYSTVTYDPNATFLNVALAQTLNRHTTSGGAEAGYALSPYTSLTIAGDETRHRFPLSPERDVNAVSTAVGLRFSPHAVISGDAAMGYTRVDPLSPQTPAFAGITPRAGVTYKLHDIFSLAFGAQRGIENSFFGDRPYYLFMLYEGSTRLALFGRFDVGGSIQYTTLDYRSFLDRPSSLDTRDIIEMQTVDAGMPIKRRLRVGVFAQRWRRLSPDRPYVTTRIGLEMTVGPASLTARGIFLSGPLR